MLATPDRVAGTADEPQHAGAQRRVRREESPKRLPDGSPMRMRSRRSADALSAVGGAGPGARDGVPLKIRGAGRQLEQSLARACRVLGNVVVCPGIVGVDVPRRPRISQGALSTVRCIDVAALVAARRCGPTATPARHPVRAGRGEAEARSQGPRRRDAAKLAAIGGGGTISAPLAALNLLREQVDLVVIVSDNESLEWTPPGEARPRRCEVDGWKRLNRPPGSCASTSAPWHRPGATRGRADILNVGGFSDAVFDTIALRFRRGAGLNEHRQARQSLTNGVVANAGGTTCRP